MVTGSTSDVTQQTLLNEAAFHGLSRVPSETRVVSAAEGDCHRWERSHGACGERSGTCCGDCEQRGRRACRLINSTNSRLRRKRAVQVQRRHRLQLPPVTPAAPTSTSPVAEAGRVPEGSESEAPEMVATAATGCAGPAGAPARRLRPVQDSRFGRRRGWDVPVVAFDKKGQPVTDLKPNETGGFRQRARAGCEIS